MVIGVINCACCGDEIEVRNKTQKFCSPLCRKNHWAKSNPERYSEIQRICVESNSHKWRKRTNSLLGTGRKEFFYKGKTRLLSDVVNEANRSADYRALYQRIFVLGWNIDRALRVPIMARVYNRTWGKKI